MRQDETFHRQGIQPGSSEKTLAAFLGISRNIQVEYTV